MEPLGLACQITETLPKDLCRAQVQRIIQSSEFDATDREGRFLKYIVEETLSGNAARIKAYSIAIAVFGRKDSFDPQTDPIVRIEASRLRRALERYYLTAGVSDLLVITIPKGHYVPTFTLRDAVPVPPGPVVEPVHTGANEPPPVSRKGLSRRSMSLLGAAVVALAALGLVMFQMGEVSQHTSIPELPQVLVEQFVGEGGAETGNDIDVDVQREVIDRLWRFRDIAVLTPLESPRDDQETSPRYVLKGSVLPTSRGFRVRARLIQRRDGAVLWSDAFDADLSATSLMQATAEIADSVATQLGQSYGVIVLADKEFKRSISVEEWDAYSCVLSFNDLRATMDAKLIPDVEMCLEKTVVDFPDYSTAWALLAIQRINALRSVFPYDAAASKVTLDQAFADARHAIALDPQNVRALQAEMLALFWNKQFAEGQVVGERALAMNPNDTDLLAEYGLRLALSGQWQKGCLMLRAAFDRDQVPIMYYNPGLALCAYFQGNITEALVQISKTTAKSHPLQQMVAAAIYAEGGNLVEADRFRSQLQEATPDLARNIRQEVNLRLGRPEDVERFLASLAKAGLT
jgi:TolB-like protein/Tfp pilus assembly protein PilF